MANWQDDGDMRTNLAWQWENNRASAYLGAFCMAAEEVGLTHQEAPFFLSPPFPAVLIQAFTRDTGLSWVVSGQQHNAPVADAYRRASDADPVRFWTLVMSSSNTTPNLTACAANIQWQWENNKESILKAQSLYLSKSALSLPAASFFLVSGQRHNPPVMDIYRATYREIPDQLFTLLLQYVVQEEIKESAAMRRESAEISKPIHPLHLYGLCYPSAVPPGWLIEQLHFDPTKCGTPAQILCNTMDLVRYDNLPVGSILDVAYVAYVANSTQFVMPPGWQPSNTNQPYWAALACDASGSGQPNRITIKKVS